MFSSSFMPCSECGESLERSAAATHRCDPERLVEYQMFGLRDEIAKFEVKLYRYLQTASGRFEVWLAARDVRNAGPSGQPPA
jgi:hypothetical protein